MLTICFTQHTELVVASVQHAAASRCVHCYSAHTIVQPIVVLQTVGIQFTALCMYGKTAQACALSTQLTAERSYTELVQLHTASSIKLIVVHIAVAATVVHSGSSDTLVVPAPAPAAIAFMAEPSSTTLTARCD
eukprot:2868-Heterococcus_DN1.PRE.1